jgi:hypothetical protein
MEKWARSLSKATALIIGSISLLAIVVIVLAIYNSISGLIPIIILCTLIGAGVGFSVPLIYKGITGYTPQERKELKGK